jgi:hypothetical protein
MTSDRLLRLGILCFWASYFTVVFGSNAGDALKQLGLLSESFAFASGNYALVYRVTRIYGVTSTAVAALFAGVLAWQIAAALSFWRAFLFAARDRGQSLGVNTAFVLGLGLWAAFILLDEILIAYETPGLETTHLGLLSAQLLSLVVFHSLLARTQAASARNDWKPVA